MLPAPQAVAQVSAAAVASAPDTTQSAAGVPASNAAPDAAAPPLASTCQASRRSPLASSAAGRWRGANRETALDSVKNANSTAPPGQPVPIRTAVPTSQARHRARTIERTGREAASRHQCRDEHRHADAGG
jgi:hypothetical protein